MVQCVVPNRYCSHDFSGKEISPLTAGCNCQACSLSKDEDSVIKIVTAMLLVVKAFSFQHLRLKIVNGICKLFSEISRKNFNGFHSSKRCKIYQYYHVFA
jgi:hypothetical protein